MNSHHSPLLSVLPVLRPWYPSVLKAVALCVLAAVIFAAGMMTQYWLLHRSETGPAINASSTPTIVLPSSPGLTEEAVASMIFMATNEARVKAGLKPLAESDALDVSAQAKLNHLLANQYWSHVAPDGTSPWDFLDRSGYRHIIAGENLAKDYATPDGVVEGWLGSPSHRENLLAPGYTEMGISVRYIEDGFLDKESGWLVVAHYATPR